MMDLGKGTSGTVVTLAAAEGAMRYRALAEVRAYWEALRKGRAVPARSEIDPRGIENALEYAFIAERIAPGMARFRLAGMHLNDLMGMEVRGMPLSSFFAPEARKKLGDVLEAVFQGPAAAEVTVLGESGIGKPPLSGRLLLLPLKSDLGDVNRMIGCLVSDGQIGRSPRRFLIEAVEQAKVRAGLPAELGAVAPVQVVRAKPAPQPGFAEPRTAFAPAPGSPPGSPEARRAMLRLVKDD